MKLKSLLFGSAAVLAAGTGALAADLPVVEPVDYVRICDAFGAKFYYIPGTDTCLRVGGYVRVQSAFTTGDVDLYYGTRSNGLQQTVVPDSEVNNYQTLARGQIVLDARTQTDYGLIRAFIAMEMTVGSGNRTTGDVAATAAQVEGEPNYDGTAPNLAAAYIQVSNDWGTYTAGHTGSFFDFWGGNGWAQEVGIEAGTGEATLFAWTFAGGNGFSFTVSAEDPASIGRRRNGDDDSEGLDGPDGVANIRVDQGWGSAQVMGAVRHINDVNGDGIGFAVGAGLSINLPGGWVFSSQGGYSEGAVAYVSSDIGRIGDFNGPTGDQQNEAWGGRGGLKGPLMGSLSGWVEGAFYHFEEDDNGDSYDHWAVTAGAAWEPVKDFYMGPEASFASFDGDDAGEDWDVWSLMWRVQRSF
jgi:hypothetical protein